MRGVQLQLEQTWFLNGQARTKTEYLPADGKTRERELDENGTVTRDDEVFEDGSRKACSR